jgi:hypothetical protein
MMPNRRPTWLFPFLYLLCMWAAPRSAQAQEFPKGWVGYLEAHQGLSTAFTGAPDLYVGGLQFRPQYTIVPNILRLGATAGLIYSNTHIDGLLGPSLSLKISDFSSALFGSIANIQLQADYWWSTRSRQYFGGGPSAELGALLTIGVTVHRDFQDNAWLFQATAGFNLFHQKRKPGTPVDPLHPHS